MSKKITDNWISSEMEKSGIEHNLANVCVLENNLHCTQVCPLVKMCPLSGLTQEEINEMTDNIEKIVGCAAVLRCPVLLYREKESDKK